MMIALLFNRTRLVLSLRMTVTDIGCDQRLHARQKLMEGEVVHGMETHPTLLCATTLCHRGQARKNKWLQKNPCVTLINHEFHMRDDYDGVQATPVRPCLRQPVKMIASRPSDASLLYIHTASTTKHLREDSPILFETPFNSKNKWQLIVVKTLETSATGHLSRIGHPHKC